MNGCGARLADDQWWHFCGETDMGQTLPALCTNCGGPYRLNKENMMNERAVEAAKRAVETMGVTGKDPGAAHFYFSLVKSGFRIIGSALLIILGFVANEPLLSYGAGMFLIAEILGIAEEMV